MTGWTEESTVEEYIGGGNYTTYAVDAARLQSAPARGGWSLKIQPPCPSAGRLRRRLGRDRACLVVESAPDWIRVLELFTGAAPGERLALLGGSTEGPTCGPSGACIDVGAAPRSTPARSGCRCAPRPQTRPIRGW